MAAVYVSADANEWWESGPVRDLTIRGNEFADPAGPAIFLDPRVSAAGEPVHHGVTIEDNRFELDGVPALEATATSGVRLHGNRIDRRGAGPDVVLTACEDVVVD